MTKQRILVAEDEPVLIEGITSTLEPYYEIVGCVTDGEALVKTAREERPELIILAISLARLDGFRAALQIRAFLPEVKLLFFTMHHSPPYVEAAMRAGANGYILKNSSPKELLSAVEQVLGGLQCFPLGLAPAGTHPRSEPVATTERLSLTPRECEVLRMIAQGLQAKEIAFLLQMSVRTVAFHRDNLKKKLRLSSTAELTKFALEQRLL